MKLHKNLFVIMLAVFTVMGQKALAKDDPGCKPSSLGVNIFHYYNGQAALSGPQLNLSVDTVFLRCAVTVQGYKFVFTNIEPNSVFEADYWMGLSTIRRQDPIKTGSLGATMKVSFQLSEIMTAKDQANFAEGRTVRKEFVLLLLNSLGNYARARHILTVDLNRSSGAKVIGMVVE